MTANENNPKKSSLRSVLHHSRKTASFLPLILIFLIGIYAYTIVASSPSTQESTVEIPLHYPPDAPIDPSNPAHATLLRVKLTYNGTLTEGQPVWLYAESDSLSQVGEQTIAGATVTFEGAEPILNSENNFLYLDPNGQGALVALAPVTQYFQGMGNATFLEEDRSTLIEWPTEGDYFPIVSIMFKNGSEVVQSYTDYRLHVGSLIELQQENYEKTNTALTIALFALALIESIYLAYDHYPRKKDDRSATVRVSEDNKPQKNNADKKRIHPKKGEPSWYRFRNPKKAESNNDANSTDQKRA